MPATRKKTGKTVVVALGGNAILQPGQVGTFEEQLFNVDGAMRRIAELVEGGWRVVLTQVAVDPADKAFANPSKPVGPFHSEAQAKKMMLEEGHAMREDAGRGWA